MGVHSLLDALLTIIGVAIIVLLLVTAYMFWRIRHLYHLGGFMCSYRPDLSAGWLEGYAVYQAEYLDWHKAAAFSLRPNRSWKRRKMELRAAKPYLAKNGKTNMSVPISDENYSFWLFMDADDHAGLVSWVEAAPPLPLDQTEHAL